MGIIWWFFCEDIIYFYRKILISCQHFGEQAPGSTDQGRHVDNHVHGDESRASQVQESVGTAEV